MGVIGACSRGTVAPLACAWTRVSTLVTIVLPVGKNSRRRRRQRKRNQTALARRSGDAGLARAGVGTVLRVQLRMEQLELAKGYDGFLRGEPEPTLLVAVYSATAAHTRLGGRYLYRFERPSGYPCKVSTREPTRESCTIVVDPGARLVILALAVEEDSGRGLQALYAELERGEGIVVWTADHVAPIPMHLHELDPHSVAPDLGHRVHVLLGERDPSQHLVGDDWVDAAMLHAAPTVQRGLHRLHFCSGDGRNDWTAALEVVVGRA